MKPKTCKHCGIEFTAGYKVSKRYWDKREYCSIPCRTEGRRGEHRASFNRERVPIAKRFWSKVNKDTCLGEVCGCHKGLGHCWLWIGAKDIHGYGYLGNRRKPNIKAHRLSFEMHKESIPNGQHVLHHCDNPPCPNPDHLFSGTQADNNADRDRKGRARKLSGEENPNSKITYAIAEQIRQWRLKGMTQQSIADRLGIHQSTVGYIDRGLRWKPRDI